ncbi:MAG: hypothetical protein MUF64_28420 [Polyangiaceae bacterium]|jgi:hypothetical protein|nr:hypothetical protein [Polyangiaceae bacterium]
MAGYLGKDKPLARNVFLSGGCDTEGTDETNAKPSAWCYLPRKTPPERMFGVLHTEDMFWLKRMIYEGPYGMSAFGAFADAGTQSPDYCASGTHILTTSLEPLPGQGPHESLASDAAMPVDDKKVPLLAEDYHYLFTHGLPTD